MINKYTLSFKDANIEKQYQEYQTITNRKPLLLKIFFISLLVNLMDFIQSIVVDSYEWVTPQLLLEIYFPYFLLQGIFLIVYFCIPNFARWALLIQNHLFAYSYFFQEFTSIEQYKYYIFAIIGTQFIIFMSGEFVEVVYQILLFSVVYVIKLILENDNYQYSLVVSGILSDFVFIGGFYINQIKLRQQFKIRFLESQWEQIFISLIQEYYLIFEYDDETYSFNFKKQHQFYGKINNTKQLRNFLRNSKIKNKTNKSLEQYLHEILHQQGVEKNIIKHVLPLVTQNQQKQKIHFSIFYGIRPILVLQQITDNVQIECQQTSQINQSYQKKYKNLIKIAYRLIIKNKSNDKFTNKLNCNRLKRYFFFLNLSEYLLSLSIINKDSYSDFCAYKMLTKIKRLFPEKQIQIKQAPFKTNIQTNWQFLASLIIRIIEKALTQDLEIKLEQAKKQKLFVFFYSYFNVRYFSVIRKLIKMHPDLNLSIVIQQIQICLIIDNNCSQDHKIRNIEWNEENIITTEQNDTNQLLKEIIIP